MEQNIQVTIRISKQNVKKVREILKQNRDVFYNLSHFIRCAVIKEIRNYKRRGFM